MAVCYGMSWGRPPAARLGAGSLAAAMLVGATGLAAAPVIVRAAGALTSVIVRSAPGQTGAVEQDIRALGGRVDRTIGIIDGVTAHVPAAGVAPLRSLPGVVEVTPDLPVHLLDNGSWSPSNDVGSLFDTTKMIGAQNLWNKGITGNGVDVALIDTGVAPVAGLDNPAKVINGPDLSFDSQAANLRYLDGYGHGTHMAGIIAGRDAGAVSGYYKGDSTDFLGVAPDSRIVNVKVADAFGNTDVSQGLAAIDWVVQHRTDNGMNIRVLNLSFGTDSTQPYALDPLAFAAEVAWHSGIVVVAAVGNDGSSGTGIADPATDPYLIAVGASDTLNTLDQPSHVPASFTAAGNGVRNPDLVGPGVHIASLRVPGSYIDQQFGSTATVGTRFFRGSGTSQATAVVSGSAALLLARNPALTPDQVKRQLTGGAVTIQAPATTLRNSVPVVGGALTSLVLATTGTSVTSGHGEVNVANSAEAPAGPVTSQFWPQATGTGTLEASRGSRHVGDRNGTLLTGERDIFGSPFNSAAMAQAEASAASWSGGVWNGASWSGASWSGASWSGASWSSASWSGASWSGASWSGASWSSASWSGASWSSASWSGASWSAASWSAASWSGASWSGASWSGASWSSASWS